MREIKSLLHRHQLFLIIRNTRYRVDRRSPIRHKNGFGAREESVQGFKAPGLFSLYFECTFYLGLFVPRDCLARLLVSLSWFHEWRICPVYCDGQGHRKIISATTPVRIIVCLNDHLITLELLIITFAKIRKY